MDFWIPLILLLLQAAPSSTSEASADPVQHVHETSDATEAAALCPMCPSTRSATGTSWQPDSASRGHVHWRPAGSWLYAAHLEAALAAVHEGGRRGDDATYTANHGMVNLRRRIGGGIVGVQSMWSLEPAIGPRGYPLLLQTGETADGVNALLDRQHPHDLPMELAATYSRQIGDARAFYVYVAAVGAPAIGPPPFMHRSSGSVLPVAPITHHWFDSTHLTYGVVTGGFVASPNVKFEGSVFRGREPDHKRWGFERPGLDSFAFRLSANPTSSLAVQMSAAVLTDAEPLHPGADVSRLTASAMYSGGWRGVTVDGLLAWGRNKRSSGVVPAAGGFYLYPGALAQAVLAEATVQRGRHAVVMRTERAVKDELFPLPDPRHSTLFPLSRVTVGYAFRVVGTRYLDAQLGVAAAWNHVDRALDSDYGDDPRSGLLFARVALH
jgi:hypothetical protein